MTDMTILLPIYIPAIIGVMILILPQYLRRLTESFALAATFINLFIVLRLFGNNASLFIPWTGWGLDISLRLYNFSAFIILAIAGFAFLITLYSVVFMRAKACLKQFYAYFLLTVAFANGVVLADNLILLLLFWEGLLLFLFGMINIGSPKSFKTAAKAFIIVGITDVCMMIGIALTGHLAGTMTISAINLPLKGLCGLAFILLMIGAISKAGSMPFHSWIPDAANDAPLPFMALVPAAFEKLLGIYFLTRISLDMFRLIPQSGMSILLMSIGGITIILAVMMALIQKDYKRLLSYHAISQVGYMILGIGTAVPAGIIGGLFHMINNALYKSCLFLTGGAVEKQAGTTNLEELGGIGKRMPVTFICFIVTAAAISGVWPLNGFFSKELVYDGALERGRIFYILAVLGSFFTAASFLKLGHAAFLGPLSDKNKEVKEAPLLMLGPMIIIALACVIFGVFNFIPLQKLIQPILGIKKMEGRDFSGMPADMTLVVITFIVLIAAFLNHYLGAKSKGSGLKAVDHIHHAPGLSAIYDKAEQRFFDPYDIGLKVMNFGSRILYWCDRVVDWCYDAAAVSIGTTVSRRISSWHNGNYATYIFWSLAGFTAILMFLLYSAH